MVCGYCGEVCGNAVNLAESSRKGNNVVYSAYWSCDFHVSYSLGSAETGSRRTPCTNRPIFCPLKCGIVIWAYNMPEHYKSKHNTTTDYPSIEEKNLVLSGKF